MSQSAAHRGDPRQPPGAPRVSSAHNHLISINHHESRLTKQWYRKTAHNHSISIGEMKSKCTAATANGAKGAGKIDTHHLELGAVDGEVVVAAGAADKGHARKVSYIYIKRGARLNRGSDRCSSLTWNGMGPLQGRSGRAERQKNLRRSQRRRLETSLRFAGEERMWIVEYSSTMLFGGRNKIDYLFTICMS